MCLLTKETIDKFINTFIGVPVIIDHKDNITADDINGRIQNIWFSPEDEWYWCSGIITNEKAVELIEDGYNVSCQYAITQYIDNLENKLQNGNPYDKEILNGLADHLAIVKNPRYEGAFIAANAFIAKNAICQNEFKEADHPRDEGGKFTDRKNGTLNSFEEKSKEIEPIKINKDDIPQFENKKEFSNWVKEQFKELGSVKINDTGIELKLSSGNANRETIKRRASKEENKAVFAKFEDIVSRAIKKDERKADDRHIKDQEIYYNKIQIDGVDYDVEIFVDKPDGRDRGSYYAGHNASKIKITPRETMGAQNELSHHAKGVNNIMPYFEIDFKTYNNDFNPIDYINKLDKGGQMTEDMKEFCAKIANAFMKAKNESDKEDEKDDKTAKNEDMDKRKLIDEIGGILKGKVDEELWQTIIGKAEKIAYDKSSVGTADNSQAKNEDEDDEDEKKLKTKRQLTKRLISAI